MKSPDELMFLFHSMVSKINIIHCTPPIFIRKNKLNVKLKSNAISKKMIASTTSERKKWKTLTDIRISTKSNTYNQRLKNSFGEIVTKNKKWLILWTIDFLDWESIPERINFINTARKMTTTIFIYVSSLHRNAEIKLWNSVFINHWVLLQFQLGRFVMVVRNWWIH